MWIQRTHGHEGSVGRGQQGQAAVGLIATLPFLALAVLIAVQLLSAGHAAWSAGSASRAVLRAEETGDDPERAARRAVAPALRGGLRLPESGRPGSVRLVIPGAAGLPRSVVRLGDTGNRDRDGR